MTPTLSPVAFSIMRFVLNNSFLLNTTTQSPSLPMTRFVGIDAE